MPVSAPSTIDLTTRSEAGVKINLATHDGNLNAIQTAVNGLIAALADAASNDELDAAVAIINSSISAVSATVDAKADNTALTALSEVVENKAETDDSRFSDARTPLAHTHDVGETWLADILAGISASETSLATLRDAAIANQTAARDFFSVLLAQTLEAASAEPGFEMVVNNVTNVVALAGPYPLRVDFVLPPTIEEQLLGRASHPIPATSFAPDETVPPALVNTVRGSGYAFDDTSLERIHLKIPIPDSVLPGTFAVTLGFTNAVSATSGVVWEISALAISAGDVVTGSLGTSVSLTHTCVAGAFAQQTTVESDPVTPAGSWAEGDSLLISIARNPADAGDTLAQDAILTEVLVHFETDQITDD